MVTVDTVQLSAVTGVPRVTPLAVQSPASALTVTFDGQVIVGLVTSTLVTVNVQLLLLPAASVAVKVTVVVPVPDSIVPAAGDCVMVIAPAAVQLSLTVAPEV